MRFPRKISSGLIGLALLLAAYAAAAWWIARRKVAEKTFPGIVIRVAHWQLEEGPRRAFDAVARRYEQLHPGVRVEQLPVPESIYPEWVRTQLGTDDPPDLVEFDPTLQGLHDVYLRDFAPITRWVDEPNPYDAGTPLAGRPWRDTFADGLMNRGTYDPQLRNFYGVGLCVHSFRLFYNRDLLRQITGRDDPPKTFEELLALGAEVRARRPDLALIAGSAETSIWAMDYLLGRALPKFELSLDRFHRLALTADDQFSAYLEGRWSYQSPALQLGLRMLQAFGAQMTPGFVQADRDQAVQRFLRGQALMFPTGSWDATTLRTLAPFQVGIIPVPLPAPADPAYGRYMLAPASDGDISVAFQIFLNRRSRHQAQAIDFLRFVTSVEGNGLFSRVSGWMPSIIGVPVPPGLEGMRPNFNGYIVGATFINGPGPDAVRNWKANFYLLFAPNGGPEKFTQALIRTGRRAAIRADLTAGLRNSLASFRDRAPSLTARYFLDAGDADAAAADAAQRSQMHLAEARAYRLARVLADTKDRP